jgi:hypothetical protein
MSLEQLMGELKGCSVPLDLDQGMIYSSIKEGRGQEARTAASVYFVRRENCFRLYFAAVPEHFDKYAARVGRTVLGQEILSQVNKVIPPTLNVSMLGAFIECQEIKGVANVFKALYGQPFTPIKGLSQKEQIVKSQDPDPDTITAQSL